MTRTAEKEKRRVAKAAIRRTVQMIEMALLLGAWRERRTGAFLPPMPPILLLEEKEGMYETVGAINRRIREEQGSRYRMNDVDDGPMDIPVLLDGVLMRLHTIPSPTARLAAMVFGGLPAEVAFDSFKLLEGETGEYQIIRTLYGRVKGKLWPCAGYGSVTGSREIQTAKGRIIEEFFSIQDVDLPIAMARVFAHSWTVTLTCPGSPGIRLFTDPTGALALLADREGERHPSGRRKALLHWVSAHYRACRNNPDDLRRIREYLRGARTFTWHGLDGTILPPE
jgi:hypothetical protein